MKVIFDKKEIPQVSKKLLDKIIKIKNKKAKVIAFSGDLGAGKTTLTKEMGKILEIKEDIISPTFVIMKIYKINSSKYKSHFKQLIHIDAYRLDSHKDLLKIGWEEIAEDKENLIIVEWPEKVFSNKKHFSLNIFLSHIDENNRLLEL